MPAETRETQRRARAPRARAKGERRGGRWLARLSGRKMLVALGLYLATVALVETGERPLRYRLGQRVPADVVVRVDFAYISPDARDDARRRAILATPNVYVEDASWSSALTQPLRNLAAAAGKSASLEEFRGQALKEGVALTEPESEALLKALLPEAPGEGETEEAKRKERDARVKREILDPAEKLVANFFAVHHVLSLERLRAERERGTGSVERRAGERSTVVPLEAALVPDDARALLRMAVAVSPLGRMRGGQRAAVERALAARLPENLRFDSALSERAQEEAQAAAEVEPTRRKAGEVLLRDGDKVDTFALHVLREEARAWRAGRPESERWLHLGGIAAVLAAAFALMCACLARLAPGSARTARPDETRMRHLVLTGAIFLGALGAFKALVAFGGPSIVTPIVLAATLAAVILGAEGAVLGSLVTALAVGLAAENNFALATALAAGGVTAGLVAEGVRRRSGPVKVGAIAGLVVAAVMVAGDLVHGVGLDEPRLLAEPAAWGLGASLLGGIVAAGILPLLEHVFGVTTDMVLFEIGDQNHPLLRRLLLEAPGTYQHSLVVGTLAEAGAEAVGANALLARVGSYFHDVGKILKPEYYVENVSARRSRHDRLSPAMSALVIVAHVKDGVAMAHAYGLPRAIVGIVEQHHGTTLVAYFYRAAQEQAGGDMEVDESAFRYPGPRPRSREAAIVLLADAVEAASRALEEPSPSRIEWLVREMIMKRLLEGQFDDCGLRLADLERVREAFVRVLISLFHVRVQYPGGAAGPAGPGPRVGAWERANGRPANGANGARGASSTEA